MSKFDILLSPEYFENDKLALSLMPDGTRKRNGHDVTGPDKHVVDPCSRSGEDVHDKQKLKCGWDTVQATMFRDKLSYECKEGRVNSWLVFGQFKLCVASKGSLFISCLRGL